METEFEKKAWRVFRTIVNCDRAELRRLVYELLRRSEKYQPVWDLVVGTCDLLDDHFGVDTSAIYPRLNLDLKASEEELARFAEEKGIPWPSL